MAPQLCRDAKSELAGIPVADRRDFPLTNPKQIRGWNGAFCEVKFSTKNQAVFAADLIEYLQEVLCADSSQCELFCCIIG